MSTDQEHYQPLSLNASKWQVHCFFIAILIMAIGFPAFYMGLLSDNMVVVTTGLLVMIPSMVILTVVNLVTAIRAVKDIATLIKLPRKRENTPE